MKTEIIDKISQYVEMDRESLLEKGVEAFLKERRRDLMLERYQILSRYEISKTQELKHKIEAGEVDEHPAWEDLITLENLDDAIDNLNEYLKDLQKAA